MGEPAVVSVPVSVVMDPAPIHRQLAAILRLCDEVGSAIETALETFDMPRVSDDEALAQLPMLTTRELRVLLVSVDASRRLPIGDDSETGRILWSLRTAITEAIYAAQRREAPDG